MDISSTKPPPSKVMVTGTLPKEASPKHNPVNVQYAVLEPCEYVNKYLIDKSTSCPLARIRSYTVTPVTAAHHRILKTAPNPSFPRARSCLSASCPPLSYRLLIPTLYATPVLVPSSFHPATYYHININIMFLPQRTAVYCTYIQIYMKRLKQPQGHKTGIILKHPSKKLLYSHQRTSQLYYTDVLLSSHIHTSTPTHSKQKHRLNIKQATDLDARPQGFFLPLVSFFVRLLLVEQHLACPPPQPAKNISGLQTHPQ